VGEWGKLAYLAMWSIPSLLEQITKGQNIGTQVGDCKMSEFSTWRFTNIKTAVLVMIVYSKLFNLVFPFQETRD
jgi:hypothetical protein